MEQDYNWDLILKVAAPVSIAAALIFYFNINDIWKLISLIAALLLAGAIVYKFDKRKNNVFTAIGIVFLSVLVVRFLKNFGII